MVTGLIGRYENWYARRLDSKPIGAVKKLSVPSTGLTSTTLSGVFFQIHKGILEQRGWQKTRTIQVRGVGFSSSLVEYRKVRQPGSQESPADHGGS